MEKLKVGKGEGVAEVALRLSHAALEGTMDRSNTFYYHSMGSPK